MLSSQFVHVRLLRVL